MTFEEVRGWMVDYLSQRVDHDALADLHDGTDLVADGIVDSMGLLQLIAELEDVKSIELDFENVEPEDLTRFGFLCSYVADHVD